MSGKGPKPKFELELSGSESEFPVVDLTKKRSPPLSPGNQKRKVSTEWRNYKGIIVCVLQKPVDSPQSRTQCPSGVHSKPVSGTSSSYE